MRKKEMNKQLKKMEAAAEANAQELLLYRTRFGPLKFPEITPEELKTAEDLGYVPVVTPMGEVQYQSNKGYTRDSEGKYAEVSDAT
jgi:hypothetical protein